MMNLTPYEVEIYSGFLFGAGVIFGMMTLSLWRHVQLEFERERHQETVLMQGKEIARLRAQVADIIGKEKP